MERHFLAETIPDIWKEIEKSNKIRQGKKSLISVFACFLTTTGKVSFLEGRLEASLCLHSNFRFF